MNKKKFSLTITIGVYIAAMAFTTLYVPVKASLEIAQGDTYTEYGYYPLWEIRAEAAKSPGVAISLNVTAWIIQYAFITLIFIILLFRGLTQ